MVSQVTLFMNLFKELKCTDKLSKGIENLLLNAFLSCPHRYAEIVRCSSMQAMISSAT